MTMKQVRYDADVLRKMKRRHIRRWQVRWTLAHGVALKVRTHGGERRFGKRGEVEGRELRVIYLERPDHVYVISAHWKLSRAKTQKDKERSKE